MSGPTRTTWVLVADGARARILESRAPGQGLVAVEAPVGGWHRCSTASFAQDMAAVLDRAAAAGAFDRLILTAPPRALRALCDFLTAPTRARLIGEVDGDLTDLSNAEIASRIRELATV